MINKQLVWLFAFLAFLGINISPEVFFYYMILFAMFLGARHVWAKSVQQWFLQGEALAKAGIKCPECQSDRLWGGANLFSYIIRKWKKYPIKCRMCGHRWVGNGEIKKREKVLAFYGLKLKLI